MVNDINESNSGLSEFQKNAVIIALRAMYKGTHFSICTLNDILKMTGKIMLKENYDALHLLHCVDWSDMGQDMMRQSFDMIIKALDSPSFDFGMMDRDLQKVLGKDGFWKKLLN